MQKKINQRVSVNLVYNHKTKKVFPNLLLWNSRLYKLQKHGLHHTYKQGITTFHVFTGCSGTLNFKLVLDSSSLIWVLEEVYDQTFR